MPRQRKSHGDRNRDAMLRARARGLVARWISDERVWLVPSVSTPGNVHRVTVRAIRGHVVVQCECRADWERDPIVGVTECQHGAAACMAAALEDLVAFDGEHWVLGETGREIVTASTAPHVPRDAHRG